MENCHTGRSFGAILKQKSICEFGWHLVAKDYFLSLQKSIKKHLNYDWQFCHHLLDALQWKIPDIWCILQIVKVIEWLFSNVQLSKLVFHERTFCFIFCHKRQQQGWPTVIIQENNQMKLFYFLAPTFREDKIILADKL